MNIKDNKNCKITINDEEIAVSEKEKTADELFKELGYKKIRDDERFIKYRKSHDNDYIVMDKETKDFIKNFDFAYWKAIEYARITSNK